ncbi:MAG: HAMP domain-containing protein [Elusimicrobia bacterium]|nr:HAMP domain-containing protein [Elusimicrobiota bacterium]
MTNIGGIKKLGLTAKLTIPFACILLTTVAVLGGVFVSSSKQNLNSSLQKKGEILARNLATALSDPFSMGEYDHIQRLLKEAHDADTDIVYATVVGQDGKCIASTEESLKNQTLNRTDLELAALKTMEFTRRDTQQPSIFELDTPIKFQANRLGVLRIGVSTSAADRVVSRAQVTFTLIGAIALVLGVLIYVYVARRVAAPLVAAVVRLEELAAGGADLNVRLPVESEDEVGQLSKAFNTFLDSLSRLVDQVRGASEQVGGSSKTLTEITQQSSANLSQSVQVMNQVSQSTGQVAQSAQLVATATQQAGSNAQQGGKLVSKVVERMKLAEASVDAAAGFIHELGKRSDQIGKIVDVITKIADQTNLLSLNAAIEAARAGEAGRGFAVVAEEIRKLAETSADSTQQITNLIREVQDQTRNAIQTTEKGNKEVAESYKITLEAEKLFSEIAREVGQINMQMSQVASNTQQVAASTEEATASSEEQSAAIEQIATNAQELSQIVQKLRSIVAQFRTG